MIYYNRNRGETYEQNIHIYRPKKFLRISRMQRKRARPKHY